MPEPMRGLPISGALPNIHDVQVCCSRCNGRLGDNVYAELGKPGLFCSSVCLNATHEPEPKYA
jgi:hypothetical protein